MFSSYPQGVTLSLYFIQFFSQLIDLLLSLPEFIITDTISHRCWYKALHAGMELYPIVKSYMFNQNKISGW